MTDHNIDHYAPAVAQASCTCMSVIEDTLGVRGAKHMLKRGKHPMI